MSVKSNSEATANTALTDFVEFVKNNYGVSAPQTKQDERLECTACSKKYIQAVGHSCGDTVGTQLVRENLAKALLAHPDVALEKELMELRKFLQPIVKYHSGDYNKWKHGGVGKNEPNYVEALNYITQYIRSKSN